MGVIHLIDHLSPEVITLVFLPPILFQSGLCINWHTFRKVAFQALLLAGPGILVVAALTGLVARYAFVGYGWGWPEALLLGAALSATDPVATIATVKKLGAAPSLSVLIEGEALLNDGTAYVLFLVLRDVVVNGKVDGAGIVKTFAELSIGGPAFGLAMAIATYVVLCTVHKKPVLEIAVLSVGVFSTMFLSEHMSVSGVLAVVCFGLFMSFRGKYGLSPGTVEPNLVFWDQLEFIINSLLFFFSGTIVLDRLKDGKGDDWINLTILFFTLQATRAIAILMMWPVLWFTGYGFGWKTFLMTWSAGLRGGVSLSLGLVVAHDPVYDKTFADQFTTQVVGSVLLTSVINGLMAKPLYQILRFNKKHKEAKELYEHAVRDLDTEMIAFAETLREDVCLRGANYEMVMSSIRPEQDQTNIGKSQWLSLWEHSLEGVAPINHTMTRSSASESTSLCDDQNTTQQLLAKEMFVEFTKDGIYKQYETYVHLTPTAIVSAINIIEVSADSPRKFFQHLLAEMDHEFHSKLDCLLRACLRLPLLREIFIAYKFNRVQNLIQMSRALQAAFQDAAISVEKQSGISLLQDSLVLRNYLLMQLGELQSNNPGLFSLSENIIMARLVLNWRKDRLDELLHGRFIDLATREREVRRVNSVLRSFNTLVIMWKLRTRVFTHSCTAELDDLYRIPSEPPDHLFPAVPDSPQQQPNEISCEASEAELHCEMSTDSEQRAGGGSARGEDSSSSSNSSSDSDSGSGSGSDNVEVV
eukprot:TRINITY_DN452_c4_g1_i2.p1 TRINITY_DN452_c4_g1~~TRINITY_DN452_c4_g1_i2.p1  ORF type:complete len:756 (+),score=170.92 TRINITY_DN452_c4_g1_i2:213-2480(+)